MSDAHSERRGPGFVHGDLLRAVGARARCLVWGARGTGPSQHGEGRPALTVSVGVWAIILARAWYLSGVLWGAGRGCAAHHRVARATGLDEDLGTPERGQGVGIGGRG